MPALSDWVEMEVLVTVKAYPSISTKYSEAVCVAGVRLDTATPEWVRLFPVGFRDLEREHQFEKYDVIHLRARKHSTDTRQETWRPDVDSIEVLRHLPAGGTWPERRAIVERLVGPSMCALRRGRVRNGPGPSLGLVKPREVRGVRVADEKAWSAGQLGTVGQTNLLTEKSELVKPAHAFFYDWVCEERGCNGHRQKIVDWELGQSYRSWKYIGAELINAVSTKWHGAMCAPDREPMFFVGDQHTRPGQFLVLGTFWPKRPLVSPQLAFELAV